MGQRIIKDPAEIVRGIADAAEIVSTTFGANPRNVSFFDIDGGISINDGVKVIRSLSPSNPEHMAGLSRLRRACDATWRITGDGTTSTAILMAAIVKYLYGHLHPEGGMGFSKEVAARVFEKGQSCIDAMILALQRMAVAVDDKSEKSKSSLRTVARIAMHNHEWAEPIADLLHQLGVGGSFTIKMSKSGKFTTEAIAGFRWDAGSAAKEQLGGLGRVTIENPLVAIIGDPEVSDLEPIRGLMNAYVKKVLLGSSQPLVLVAPHLSGNALASLVNATTNTPAGPARLPIYLVKTPLAMGYEALEDLAVVTGAEVFNKTKGVFASEPVSDDQFGEVASVTISATNVMFVPLESASERIARHDETLDALANEASTTEAETSIRARIANIRGQFGIIEVHATTDTEMNNISEMIEDCYRAVQSAMQHGVLPGAGRGLLFAGQTVNTDFSMKIGKVIAKALDVLKYFNADDGWATYNLWTQESGNAFDVGVLDNAASVIESLRNAWIEAQLLLNSEYFIIAQPD